MPDRNQIENMTEEFLQPIIKTYQVELVDVDYVKEAGHYYLRAYIDKETGVTINDCEDVSRALEVILDEKDLITGEYILEVSSPGLDRPLKKEKDFKRSIGKEVEVKLYQSLKNQKEWVGTLIAYTASTVTLQAEKEEVTLERKGISRIRLAVTF